MKLEGKIIDFLGDSITEGWGVANVAANRYDNRLKALAGLGAVHNYGIGGTRIAHQIVPSTAPRFDLCMCGRAYDLDRSADIIVVYGGVNDYLHGDAPIGVPTHTAPNSFWGGVRFLMHFLKTEYPGKTIVFMTPAHCFADGHPDSVPSPDNCKRDNARPLVEYVNIIKACGEEFGIPVLDLYHTLGIDPNREDDRAKYTTDGLHFNDAGHEILAKRLMAFLEEI